MKKILRKQKKYFLFLRNWFTIISTRWQVVLLRRGYQASLEYMAFVDPDSTSGNLVPTAEIIQAFPDDDLNSDMLHTNGDFFEAVSFSGSSSCS